MAEGGRHSCERLAMEGLLALDFSNRQRWLRFRESRLARLQETICHGIAERASASPVCSFKV